ncbi:MAG TPA: hypothetical protein VMG10_12695 [Gemmataceae bacterium]|nr:hypothetical protein [Gemmataceae bacterium]
MKTDEEIERERAALEPLIGPTRVGWYAEACRVEYDDPPDVVLWACRYREMAMEAGQLEMKIAELQAERDRLKETLAGEVRLAEGDGTDRLLTVLYGESSARTIGKAIGGSRAPMLWDAAEEIVRLRGLLDRPAQSS